jgi:hypothetical protein
MGLRLREGLGRHGLLQGQQHNGIECQTSAVALGLHPKPLVLRGSDADRVSLHGRRSKF